MKVASDVFFVFRTEHPAGGLVDGKHTSILVQDLHQQALRQFDIVRLGHGR
jgi:hypothetical protein